MKYFIIALNTVFFFSCVIRHTCPGCGCDNVDDCLSKYKFQEARTAASYIEDSNYGEKETKNKALAKVIKTECSYWISQNELEKAKEISNEWLSLQSMGRYDIQDRDLKKMFCDINIGIIRKYCEIEKYKDAQFLAKQLFEKCILTESEIDIDHDDVGNYKSATYHIRVCREKYNAIKKGLKPNQEIEPFKESERDSYTIYTYEYPQKEAMKIIEEFKKQNKWN